MGAATALLVFTGFWMASEFLMDRKSRDARWVAWAGLLLIVVGGVIASGATAMAPSYVALVLVLALAVYLFVKRASLDFRRWVIWTWMVLGLGTGLAIATALA